MIPYRAKRVLRRLATVLLVLVLAAALVLLGWLLWLNRYVIYTREGAKLDFSLSAEYPSGVAPVPPEPPERVEIVYKDPEEEEIKEEVKEFTRFSGYSVDLQELIADFDAVEAKLAQLPDKSTVLLDVKGTDSHFYYTSVQGLPAEKFDITRMDALIQTLRGRGHYLIARIPAFQEYTYFVASPELERQRVPYGLPEVGKGGSLWLDKRGKDYFYWLNPASDGTVTYLIQIISELRSLGFDEVVLKNFCFPDTDRIIFKGDQMEALNTTAQTLVKTCATDTFAVSFVRQKPDLKLPEGKTRIYLTEGTAAEAKTIAQQAGFPNPQAHVVFITELNDTRFDEFSVLRPLSSLH